MSEKSVTELIASSAGVLEVGPSGEVEVKDAKRLRAEVMDDLARLAVFAPSEEDRDTARVLIWEAARQTGAVPASIQPLYEAMAREEVSGFTTPAINIRGIAYDSARAVFAAVGSMDVGAFILELARSEMGYTFQRPAEYASVVLAAAVREGYRGPVFIQGDHYQVNAKVFARGGESRADEIGALKSLIGEAIAAGYGNIDIDASTIVDLSRSTISDQQRDNYEISAELAAHTRSLEPDGVTVSIGGEIGEVGKKNSTPEELRAYMDGFLKELESRRPGAAGPSKISVQTGTSHGGVPLPDGSIAEVKLDFRVLEEISKVARKEYKMAGAVQHGASTLPAEAFDRFPKSTACEVHLATDFQNIVLDHPLFPAELRGEMYAWCDKECASERKPDMSAEQFYYKTRKKTWGPFKRQAWDLDASTREAFRTSLKEKFEFLFGKLGVRSTAAMVKDKVKPVEVRKSLPRETVRTR